MDELISRRAAIDALARMMPRSYTPDGSHPADEEIFRAQEVFADCIEVLEILPSAQPERKHGKWTEKEVIYAEEAKEVITEWQSCRCPLCKRYDTRPYMYYFSEPNYCSFCGADMREESDNGRFD